MTRRPADGSAAWPVWLLVGALAGAAGWLQLAVLPRWASGHAFSRPSWLALAVGFAAAETCVVHIRFGREAHSFGLGEIPLVLGLFLVAPTVLVTARLAGAALSLVWHRRQGWMKLAFNLAQWWLATAVALIVWHALYRVGASVGPRGWLGVLVAVATTDVLSTVTISAVIRLRGGRPGAMVATSLWTGLLTSAVNGCFGLVCLAVLRADPRGVWALVVVAVFVGLAQRAHVALQRRHDALERLDAFSRRLGCELHLEAVAAEVLAGVRRLLDAHTATMTLEAPFAGAPAQFVADEHGVRRDEPEPVAPARRGRRRAAALTVRLHGDGGQIGTLTVQGRVGDLDGFGGEERRLLRALAGHAGIALQNGRLVDRLRRQLEENEYHAEHDLLTGLLNRRSLGVRIGALRAAALSFAMLLIDLDRFKDVNDTLGHATGDELLRRLAERLASRVPPSAEVFRLGGDEFAVLLPDADPRSASATAQRLRASVQEPFALHGMTFGIDASIGIALSGRHGDDAEALLRHADVAMYTAKEERTGVEVYDPAQDRNTAGRLALVGELRAALSAGELVLDYQPKARLGDGAVVGVEALVRWRHPRRGILGPDEFVPLAEQAGLITPLTDWVLETALAQCRAWLDRGTRLGVAVNISPRTLRDPGFPAALTALLARHGVPPELLTVEITEGSIMTDPEQAIRLLRQIRRAGVQLSIDDLGTGHSALAYLKRLPVHEVKIDKSFVLNMVDDPDDDAIVSTMVDLVHRLHLRVVAEGVEDEATWRRLGVLGADAAQGYWLGRPMAAAAVEPWMTSWSPGDGVPAQRGVADDRMAETG